MIKKFKDMNPGDYFRYNGDEFAKVEAWNMEEKRWEHKAINLINIRNFKEFGLDEEFNVFASNYKYKSKEKDLN